MILTQANHKLIDACATVLSMRLLLLRDAGQPHDTSLMMPAVAISSQGAVRGCAKRASARRGRSQEPPFDGYVDTCSLPMSRSRRDSPALLTKALLNIRVS